MNAAILIVVTYLGGSAWGPQVTMQTFSSQAACESGKTTVLAMIDELNKTNLTGGQPHFRDLVKAICVPSTK